MWKRKERRRQREKGSEKDFTSPGSAEGSSSSGLVHVGLQFVSFYHPCPSFGRAPKLVRLMSSLSAFGLGGLLGNNFSFPADVAIV